MIRLPDSIAEDPRAALRTAQEISARSAATALLFITLVAAFLRLWKLGEWSYWADEVATLRDARNLGAVIFYPIGYALIGAVTRVWGEGEFVARLVPALAGIVTVPAVYFVGRDLFSRRAGLFAAGMAAVSSYHIYYSQYARYYTLLVLFSLLGMWAAHRGIGRNRRGWIVASVGLLALAFLTHWTAGLLVPALACWAVSAMRSADRPHGATFVNFAILFGPVAAGGLALTPVALRFLGEWTAGAPFSPLRAGLFLVKLADRLDLAVLFCALAGLAILWAGRDGRLAWAASYALVPPALAAVLIAFSQGGSRFAIVCLPPFLLLAAAAMDRLIVAAGPQRRRIAWLLVATVGLSLGMKDGRYFTSERGQRPRWREAVEYVDSRFSPEVRRLTNAPAIVAFYSQAIREKGARVEGLSGWTPDALAASGSGTVLMIEHVANIAPTPAQAEVIEKHYRQVAALPLRVRLLNYSITIHVRNSMSD